MSFRNFIEATPLPNGKTADAAWFSKRFSAPLHELHACILDPHCNPDLSARMLHVFCDITGQRGWVWEEANGRKFLVLPAQRSQAQQREATLAACAAALAVKGAPLKSGQCRTRPDFDLSELFQDEPLDV
ncbi:hypothetical protein [Deinococcus misasensis]|uniref:hypothetical protein n=1 Tax=Deinococcus misasensis TaxID=392413 RepID=UPI00054F9D99|nr:hypothetical protein [Deinococcus misasensis]